MKIYVITKGDYSDYHICAVATDPEKAERLAKIYTDRWEYAKVEEFDTEDCVDLLAGRIPYEVGFMSNGDVLPGYPEKRADAADSWEPGVELYEPRAWSPYERLFVRVLAKDPDTALKIAVDKRAQYLAEKAGI